MATAAVKTPNSSGNLPMVDDARVMPSYRVGKAFHHFRELLKDKEDTSQVFHIFESLPWKGVLKAGPDFLATEKGGALEKSEPYLPPMLDDHAALRRLPAGSVAHAYCDFMEKEGLTAQGLVDEFEKFNGGRYDFKDRMQWYFNRMRDTHDLLHVLTGYGRDALGEACVLAFTYSQQPSPANLFIAYLAGLNIRNQTKGRASAPVLKAVREGQKLGKACPRIIEQPIRDLLAMPLQVARAKLDITPPKYYTECHRIWPAAGIDPYDLLGNSEPKGAPLAA